MTTTRHQKRKVLFLWFSSSWWIILCSANAGAGASPGSSSSSSLSIQSLVQQISRRGHMTLTRSVPALSVYSRKANNGDDNDQDEWLLDPLSKGIRRHKTMEVSTKKTKRKRKKHQEQLMEILPKPQDVASSLQEQGGFYYGFSSKALSKATEASPKTPRLSESMMEALEELRIMRKEMETMRQEMQSLKRKMISDGDLEEEEELSEEQKALALKQKRRRQKECEKVAREIEQWARTILQETEEDGWKEVTCQKMMKKNLNPTERTSAYIKWMKDSRGEWADPSDEQEYACIKCHTIIDAPLEDVCTYLAEESAMAEYNDIVVNYKDVEEVSPSTKICWSQTPQILFLKPRDFVTLCHHRWREDGSEVVVNQAWEHPDYPGSKEEREGKACRAYAIRGANFFSRCPDDPNRTKISIIAHANPGGNVPQWAAKTAVNALAPIEPFKLFHKINEAVKKHQPQLRERLQRAEMVSTQPPGRSPRPAGIAQLGYACFWPNGGGLQEGANKPKLGDAPDTATIKDEMESRSDESNEGSPSLSTQDEGRSDVEEGSS